MATLTKEQIKEFPNGDELINYLEDNVFIDSVDLNYIHIIDGHQQDSEFKNIEDLSNNFSIVEFEDDLNHWKIIGIQWSEDSYLVVFRKSEENLKSFNRTIL